MEKWKTYILSCIWVPSFVAQIVLVLVLGRFNEMELDEVMYAGWVIWTFSVIFGIIPIFTFKRKGGVAKGKSYVHTTTLVDTGIYSIVRHPQYTAGILFSLALVLWAQNWLVLALGSIVIPLVYIDMMIADANETEKFGDEYIRYMERVPRANFILGIVRVLRRRTEEEK
jgi:protein-S-isoprenylcysteine O-methyltransferase Ste14